MSAAIAWKWAVDRFGLAGVLLGALTLCIFLWLGGKMVWALGSSAWYEWQADRATTRAENAEIRAETAETNLAGANTDAAIAGTAAKAADAGTHESRTATSESESKIHAIANRPRAVRADAVDPDLVRELQAGAGRIRAAQDRLRGTQERRPDAERAELPKGAEAWQ